MFQRRIEKKVAVLKTSRLKPSESTEEAKNDISIIWYDHKVAKIKTQSLPCTGGKLCD